MTDMTNQAPTTRSYEFDDQENQRIARTAGLARTWGMISLGIGILALLGTLVEFHLITALQGITAIVIGVVFLNVGKAFNQVVHTEGDDIAHMLGGLHNLGNAFQIQIIMTLLTFIIGTVLGVMQVTGG